MIAKTTKPTTEKISFSRKFWTFGILSAIAYVLFFSTLFMNFIVVQSMIFVLLFFLFFQFFYLEIRKFPIKYLLMAMLIISSIWGFFIGYTNILLVASMFSINAGIVYLARLLQWSSHDKVKRDTLSYLTTWGYMFTVFITLWYSLFVLGYYAKFPFTCQDLSDASNRVINVFTNPVTKGVEKVKTDTSSFFSTKVKDIAIIGQDLSLQTKQSSYSLIVQKFNTFKKNLIDQTLKDNSTVNMGICDYLLGQMNLIYENPAFKTSVILLMFLLLYGFIRIVFWVMTGIAFIIFKTMLTLKAYHIHTVMKEVEDLE